jgi:hypothetical protein
VIFANLELARRLETAEAANAVECVEAQRMLDARSQATVEQVAGGWAVFIGAGSPLTRAVGLGMQGAVRTEDLDRLEAFYQARGAPVSVDLCPLADPSLLECLASRGYRPTEFNNVLVRTLGTEQIAPVTTVARAGFADGELWASTVGRGFLEKDTLAPEELDVGRVIFQMRGSQCFWAFSEGQPVAAAALAMREGLAVLFADSTIEAFRGRGLHNALIRERLRVAGAQGCELATASTLPGSGSQRNFERNGFQVVYTKVVLMR